MKATICPNVVLLTKAQRATVSIMAKGCIYCGLSTASEVIPIFTTHLTTMYIYHICT